MMRRDTWDDYFLNIADVVRTRSTCLRRQWGAVAVDKKHSIVATGYNGVPSGYVHCTERGVCERQVLGILSGQHYERCYSLHAEMNVIIQAARSGRSIDGCTIYLSGWDLEKGCRAEGMGGCLLCSKMMLQSGVERVVEREPDGSVLVMFPAEVWAVRLREAGMKVPD
jgi:dCMP deaminase